MIKRLTLAAAVLSTASLTATAAPTYEFNAFQPKGGTASGDILDVYGKYDASSQQLSFKSTINQKRNNLADGFWLVLSDGPNPKNHVDEYAIFYGDGKTGRLTSYVYSGRNSANSYKSEQLLASFNNALNVETSANGEQRTFSFTNLDISGINNYLDTEDWDGAAFGEKVGVWFHPTVLGQTAYSEDGALTQFEASRSSWYDVGNVETVPEPAGLALLAGTLGLLAAARRKNKA